MRPNILWDLQPAINLKSDILICNRYDRERALCQPPIWCRFHANACILATESLSGACVAFKSMIRLDTADQRLPQEVSEGLDGQNSAWHGLFILNGGFIDGFKRRPPAPAELGQQLAVIQKVPSQDLWNAEHHMPVRNRFYNVPAQPCAELNHPLLVARRAEMAAFTRKCQQA